MSIVYAFGELGSGNQVKSLACYPHMLTPCVTPCVGGREPHPLHILLHLGGFAFVLVMPRTLAPYCTLLHIHMHVADEFPLETTVALPSDPSASEPLFR